MKTIDIIREFLMEGGIPTSNFRTDSIDIYPPRTNDRPHTHHYRLTVKNNDVLIKSLKLSGRMTSGRMHYIPEGRLLLSVDLHDPDSLTHLRQWLGSIGHHSSSNLP